MNLHTDYKNLIEKAGLWEKIYSKYIIIPRKLAMYRGLLAKAKTHGDRGYFGRQIHGLKKVYNKIKIFK